MLLGVVADGFENHGFTGCVDVQQKRQLFVQLGVAETHGFTGCDHEQKAFPLLVLLGAVYMDVVTHGW